MNKHTPIMDTLPTNVVSSRKRRKSNSSSDGDQDSDVEDIYFPEWNLVWPRYIVLSPLDDKEPLTKLSPFAVEKGIQGKFGTVHKVTKMRSGSLLIEATRAAQARNILDTTKFLDIEVKATPHRSLNSSKGVIRDHGRDLYDMSEADIVMELKDQGVDGVSRFILKKDGKEIKTNTLFVTFCTPTPPPKLKIGYYNVEVKLYIPNPLRCFHCQEFGHSRKYCKKQLKCWKCGKEGHDGSECSSETLCCVNCKGDHCSSSKACPIWIREKEIQRVKAEKSLPYGEARRLVEASSPSATSSSSPAGPSYASALRSAPRKVTISVDCQTPAFWVGKQPTLLEASKLSPVQTSSTGTGTHEPSPSYSRANTSPSTREDNVQKNKKDESKKYINKDKPQHIETGNKFQSLTSEVDEDMDTTSSPRLSRSRSRPRTRMKTISPIKHH